MKNLFQIHLDARRQCDQISAKFGLNVPPREMEYKVCASYKTFYPFQKKDQIHRHLQSVKKLYAFEKSKFSVS